MNTIKDPESMTDDEADAEMQAAFAEYCRYKANDWDDDCGYDKSDPKHPTYAERMADAADYAKKLARGE